MFGVEGGRAGIRFESREVVDFAIEELDAWDGAGEREVEVERGDPVRGYEDSLSRTWKGVKKKAKVKSQKADHSIPFSQAPNSL